MRNLISSVLILLLLGCTATDGGTPASLDLPWPTPMLVCRLSGVEVLPDGKIVLSYKDNINIAVCERDMFRYIKDLTAIICIYQPNDERCKIKGN